MHAQRLFINNAEEETEDDMNFLSRRTPGKFFMGAVTSAFQKAIRLGDLDMALFWGSEMDLAGFGKYTWKRMFVIASEDIGIANPHLPATLKALHERWEDAMKQLEADHKKNLGSTRRFGDRLIFVHAIALLVESPKSRMVNNALMYFYLEDRAKMHREIPDYAYDQHTSKGRSMGRGAAHFCDVGAKVNNCTIEDPYEGKIREYMLRVEAERKRRPHPVESDEEG